MILGILTWFLSVPILATLLVLGVVFEHFDCRKIAVLLGIGAATISYFLFELSVMTMVLGLIGYVIIGVVWSFWRYKRHVDKIVEQNKDENDTNKKWAIQAAAPTKMTSALVSWLLIWPVSMVALSLSDIINLAYRLVTTVFKSVYAKIYSSAADELGVKL